MKQRNRTPDRDLSAYSATTVSEYADGSVEFRLVVMDASTHKMVARQLAVIDQPMESPWARHELHVLAACEYFAHEEGLWPVLPL